MMRKINVIQVLPYFPPHKGGLETHAEEWAIEWVKKGFGNVINLVFDIDQDKLILNSIKDNSSIELIKNNKSQIIGYKQKGYTVYLITSFELIHNFPVPKFRLPSFWKIFSIIKSIIKLNNTETIIQTRTRFFISSFLGGVFAKINKIKWVHIEHGCDYVILSSKFYSFLSYVYDRIIGKWIFKKADKIVAISQGVKDFLNKEYTFVKDIEIIHRGVNFVAGDRNLKDNNEITIGFVGRLVKLKGIDFLINSFYELLNRYPNIKLHIVGDGDEKQRLEEQVNRLGIKDKAIFYGYKNSQFIAHEFLNKIDILANFSYQEGLPSNIIEGLLSSCVCVATDVGGTKEISDKSDLILVEKGNLESMINGLEKAIESYKQIHGISIELIKNRFSWDKNIEKYYKLYEKVL